MISAENITYLQDFVAKYGKNHRVTVKQLPPNSESNPTNIPITKCIIMPALEMALTMALGSHIGASGGIEIDTVNKDTYSLVAG